MALCLLHSLLFVVFLAVHPQEHPPASLARNSPKAIVNRITLVAQSCTVSLAATAAFIAHHRNCSLLEGMGHMGINSAFAQSIWTSSTLTISLFLGPIFYSWVGPQHSDSDGLLVNFRNLVFAPVAEELVFRSCIIPTLHLAGYSDTRAILEGSLWFGIAHMHHARELLRQGFTLKNVLFATCLTFTYTWLFAIFSAFILLKTGNIAGPIVSHMICNCTSFSSYTRLWIAGLVIYGITTLEYRKYLIIEIILFVHILGVALFVSWIYPLLA